MKQHLPCCVMYIDRYWSTCIPYIQVFAIFFGFFFFICYIDYVYSYCCLCYCISSCHWWCVLYSCMTRCRCSVCRHECLKFTPRVAAQCLLVHDEHVALRKSRFLFGLALLSLEQEATPGPRVGQFCVSLLLQTHNKWPIFLFRRNLFPHSKIPELFRYCWHKHTWSDFHLCFYVVWSCHNFQLHNY